jgi:hypothetical protein
MKKILEFNYPEDEEEFKLHLAGPELSFVLKDLDDYLRGKMKYEELTETQYSVYEEVRGKLNELVLERGLSDIV